MIVDIMKKNIKDIDRKDISTDISLSKYLERMRYILVEYINQKTIRLRYTPYKINMKEYYDTTRIH